MNSAAHGPVMNLLVERNDEQNGNTAVIHESERNGVNKRLISVDAGGRCRILGV